MLMLGTVTGQAVLHLSIVELQLEQLIISRRRRRSSVFWHFWKIRWLFVLTVILGASMAVNSSHERWALPEDRKTYKKIGCASAVSIMIFSAVATFVRTKHPYLEHNKSRLWVQRCRVSLLSLLLAGALAWTYQSLNPRHTSHHHKFGKAAGYTWYNNDLLKVVEAWSRQRWYVCALGESAVTWLSDHINHSTENYASLCIFGYLAISNYHELQTSESISVRHPRWVRYMLKADKKQFYLRVAFVMASVAAFDFCNKDVHVEEPVKL